MFKIIIVILTSYFILHTSAYAHPGGLDSNGGHYCRTNCAKYGLEDNQYHWHNPDGSISLSNPNSQTPSQIPQPTPSQNQNSNSQAASNLIILSEFMPDPGDGNEWAEIYNPTNSSADLSGYKIDDIEGASSPFTIAEDTIIGAYQYLFFSFSSKLNNSGDSLRLLNKDGQVLEEYSYQSVTKGVSFAKDTIGIWQQTTTPTQGQSNIITAPVIQSGDSKPSVKATTPTTVPTTKSNPQAAGKASSQNQNSQVLSQSTQTPMISSLKASQSASTASSNLSLDQNKSKSILAVIFILTGGIALLSAGIYRYYANKNR